MHPILFTIGNFTFYTHGLLAVLGIILGVYTLYHLAREEKFETKFLLDDSAYSVLIGIIGARITYFLMYRSQFAHFSEIFQIWDGGMVSYGGFVLAGLAFWYFFSKKKENLARWFDILAISFAPALILGRIGNIFAGEYSGVVTTAKINFSGVVPVPLYEALLLLLLSALLFTLYFKSKKKLRAGIYFSIFLAVYGIGRFIIDIWRDESHLFLNISLGQIASLTVGIVGIINLWNYFYHKRKEPK
ncbi:MAG: prolipoprotein diacylglyceryl transferase family protein [Candidatus Berkelbacteria bacterium]